MGMTEVAMARPRLRQRLGDLLVSDGLITAAQLTSALADQKRTGERLGRILVARQMISEAQLVRTLARHFGLDSVDLDETIPDFNACRLLRESFARRHNALPIGWDEGRLVVAMANPADVFALDDIRSMTGYEVKPVMAEPTQLAKAVDRVWNSKAEEMMRLATDTAAELEPPEAGRGLTSLREAAEDAPVIQFVNELVTRAVHEGASDVHMEPGERELRIRFRIDGVLHDVMTVPRSIRASVVSRLKIMGELNIAERRVPQDGRVTMKLPGGNVDLRLVTLPTTQGECLVIRILDRSGGLLQIEDLGFLPETLTRYRACYRRPWGAVLATGPTGSGKSTTLYATLTELHDPQRNIVTVEDPVEYYMSGIKQMQVNRKAGLTFASALRSIVRSDPDIILVGEIRDAETATIAIEAALTGHVVLSTVHTNDAASTPARLMDMGVEPFLVTSAVTGILAQRLVRRLCDRCKQPYNPRKEELVSYGWTEDLHDAAGRPQFYRAVGCMLCSRSGYRGRFAIHEVMPVTEELTHLILARATFDQVNRLAREQGMITLREDGLCKVAMGQTTFEELLRVVA
ncbi:MAG: Flp pilus assembly complex ATPase component TadA [Actinomycetota bacterium]|nr:Flp pilus assembly complex ATPase component TadA [Actinomycetota bacterium]